MRNLFIMSLLSLALIATAVSLAPVGVLGNSGVAGGTLLSTRAGGYPGGVVLDDELTFWRSASPTRLERVSLDGRLLAAFAIPGGQMGDPGHNVRVGLAGDYVLVLQPDQSRLYAIRRDATPEKDAMKPLALKPALTFWYASGLGARGIGGQAIVDTRTAVHAVDPATGNTTKLFDVPDGIVEHGLEVGPDGTIYVSGGGKTFAYNVEGKLLRSGNGSPGRLNAIPNALLAFSYNTVQAVPAELSEPKNLFWNAGIEVGRAGQAVALDASTIAVATQGGPLYLGEMKNERITFFRRIGAVTVTALGINADGDVFGSAYGGILTWHWRDPADAIPFANPGYVDSLNVRQIVSHGSFTWGIKQSYRADQPMQAWAWPPSRYGTLFSELKGERPIRPLGLAITEDSRVFMTAEKSTDLFTTIARPDGYLNDDVTKIVWDGNNPLANPTELAGWSQGRVLVADDNAVVLLEPAGDRYREAWRFTAWGDTPEQRFGKEIHLASAGDLLLVSDTQRHRVLAFQLPDHKLVATLGNCDKAGTALGTFDAPTCIAANGNRVAVFDSGNQRIVTCEIRK